MILDTLSQSGVYGALGARIAKGLDWLETFSPDTPDGRYEIDGKNRFALVQSYDTVPASEKQFEEHRLYADIQFVASGVETIHYAPTMSLSAVTSYDAERDLLLFADPVASTPLRLDPGSFAVSHPHDGHKPGCEHGGAAKIKKVVIKVRVG